MRSITQFTLASTALSAILSLNASAQTVKATINFPDQLAGIAVDSVINKIYVVEPSFGGASDTLAVIDGKSNTVVKSITVPLGAYLPAVDLFTHRVYVASCNNYIEPAPCFVSVVDPFLGKTVAKIPVSTGDAGIQGIAVDSVADQIYISDSNNNRIVVVTGCRNRVTKSIGLSSEPLGLAVNLATHTLYVPTADSTLDVINPKTGTTIASTSYGDALAFAAVNVVTGNVFVTNNDLGLNGLAGVFDKSANPLASLVVGDSPYGIDVDPVTNVALVADSGLNAVTEINGKTNIANAPLLGIPANFVAIDFATKTGYVAGGTTVTVVTE